MCCWSSDFVTKVRGRGEASDMMLATDSPEMCCPRCCRLRQISLSSMGRCCFDKATGERQQQPRDLRHGEVLAGAAPSKRPQAARQRDRSCKITYLQGALRNLRDRALKARRVLANGLLWLHTGKICNVSATIQMHIMWTMRSDSQRSAEGPDNASPTANACHARHPYTHEKVHLPANVSIAGVDPCLETD